MLRLLLSLARSVRARWISRSVSVSRADVASSKTCSILALHIDCEDAD